MKKLLEYLVKEIVSQPRKVKIEETVDGDVVNITFSVAQEDMGLVIGKDGRTISAIRSLLKTAAIKSGKELFIKLEEKE